MASSRSNLLGLGETPAQYFDRFDNTWEPDPDRPGLVRRKDPEINHDDIDDESFEERRVKRRRSNLVIPRTPDTIEVTRVMPLRPVTRVMPLRPSEPPAQYFDRFENTWEPDPDRPGLVRIKDPEINHDDIDDKSFEERQVVCAQLCPRTYLQPRASLIGHGPAQFRPRASTISATGQHNFGHGPEFVQ